METIPETPAAGIGTDFEKAHGQDLTRALLAMPKPCAADLIRGSGPADSLRDSYPEYWDGEDAPATREESAAALEAHFPNLPAARRAQLATLISFAVHTEMKHWENPEYVLNFDHRYELLIDPAGYRSETDFAGEGQDANRCAWADLADTAAFHAAAENAAAEPSVHLAA